MGEKCVFARARALFPPPGRDVLRRQLSTASVGVLFGGENCDCNRRRIKKIDIKIASLGPGKMESSSKTNKMIDFGAKLKSLRQIKLTITIG